MHRTSSNTEPPSGLPPPDQSVDDQDSRDQAPPDQSTDDQDSRDRAVTTVHTIHMQQRHSRPVPHIPRAKAALIPNAPRNDARYIISLNRCHADVKPKLHQFIMNYAKEHGHLNCYFVIGPLSSFNCPRLYIPENVIDQDGAYEWCWDKDITGTRTICCPTIAAVAPATQLRSDAHIVTLMSPSTPVLVHCPPGSNHIKPGAPVLAICRVNIYNHLVRMANGIRYQFSVTLHIIVCWVGM